MEYERFDSAVLFLHEHTPRLVAGARRVRCIDQGSDVFLLGPCVITYPSQDVTIIEGTMPQYKLFFHGTFLSEEEAALYEDVQYRRLFFFIGPRKPYVNGWVTLKERKNIRLEIHGAVIIQREEE